MYFALEQDLLESNAWNHTCSNRSIIHSGTIIAVRDSTHLKTITVTTSQQLYITNQGAHRAGMRRVEASYECAQLSQYYTDKLRMSSNVA